MTQYTGSTQVAVEARTLFAYLSDVENLPDYFPRLTSAERREGDEIAVTASVPDGEGGTREEGGTAQFRIEKQDTSLTWESPGPNNYSGRLDLDPVDDSSCTLTVVIDTERGGERTQEGVDEAVAGVKQAAERRHS